MKTLVDQLSQYADYHRDGRNILTHFVGVPMILFAVVTLLSLPAWVLGDSGFVLSPAVLAALAASVYYMLLDTRYGISLAVVLGLMLAAGAWLAQQTLSMWLGAGMGLFVVGWVIQFVGHYWEGRKPAFMDDIVGLLIGPLFVLAELGFVLGLRKEVQHAIEMRSGPVRHARQAVL
ncbi:Mpo1-like protein [Comamonas sp.]|uniref:Mpo1 family 2-hydroxy fatty acid dioxygenase n=1 Tax=Comamonas sp. TaxID=34028 RepID=UPI00289D2BBC|nr:Mpo1-like protein [Comamonas sp.]